MRRLNPLPAPILGSGKKGRRMSFAVFIERGGCDFVVKVLMNYMLAILGTGICLSIVKKYKAVSMI